MERRCTHLDSVFHVPHVNKCKSARATGLMIVHQVDVVDGTVARKQVFNFALSRVQAQAENAQTATDFWSILQNRDTALW